MYKMLITAPYISSLFSNCDTVYYCADLIIIAFVLLRYDPMCLISLLQTFRNDVIISSKIEVPSIQFFLDISTFEDETVRLSRNVGNL